MVSFRRNVSALALVLLVVMLTLASVGRAEEDPGAPMEGIVAFDEASFAELVGHDRGALVEFYAPWCGHCKTMAPEYRALGELYTKTDAAQKKLVIGKVDATKNRELATAHGVTGFPTILYFPPHSTTPEKFQESRSLDGFVKFLQRKITGLGLFVPKVAQAATEVTAADFDQVILDPTKDAFVLMYAPWCGHCKGFKPTYNKLAEIYENEEDLVVAMFDADAKDHKEIGARYKINGYPTVLFFPKDKKDAPVEYEGSRELAELVVFLNDKTGKKRLMDGDLSWSYGVEERLSKAIAGVLNVPEEKRAAAITAAEAQLAKHKDLLTSEYYTKVLSRIQETPEFIRTEKARLEGLMAGSVGRKKRDMLNIRFNVLASIEKHL